MWDEDRRRTIGAVRPPKRFRGSVVSVPLENAGQGPDLSAFPGAMTPANADKSGGAAKRLVGGVVPGLAETDGHVHRDVAELVGRAHLATYQLLDCLALPRRHFQHELVVNLQQQPRPQ